MITIEMVDTGIKIAVGLFVGVMIVWLWHRARLQGEQVRQHEMLKRRHLLEQVAKNVGHVHHVYQQYLSLAVEYAQYGSAWPQSRQRELNRVSQELVEVFRDLTEAESTLLLLGERNLEKALRIYGSKIVMLRRQLYVNKDELAQATVVGIDDTKREIAHLKQTFFDALSDRYLMKRAA